MFLNSRLGLPGVCYVAYSRGPIVMLKSDSGERIGQLSFFDLVSFSCISTRQSILAFRFAKGVLHVYARECRALAGMSVAR